MIAPENRDDPGLLTAYEAVGYTDAPVREFHAFGQLEVHLVPQPMEQRYAGAQQQRVQPNMVFRMVLLTAHSTA